MCDIRPSKVSSFFHAVGTFYYNFNVNVYCHWIFQPLEYERKNTRAEEDEDVDVGTYSTSYWKRQKIFWKETLLRFVVKINNEEIYFYRLGSNFVTKLSDYTNLLCI